MSEDNPKLFISYSWTSPEHEQWVLNLATELQENAVEVMLDKWDLREGHDATAFMERMVSDPEIKKVILVCDQAYAQKADGRSGGVGTETQIISPEIYAQQDQSKFVAVVAEKDETGKPWLPIYYRSRIYIDLSDPDRFATNFERLLRWVYDKPGDIKPELGKKPAFLSEVSAISLGTTTTFRRAIDGVRNSREYSRGALSQYFDAVIENLERFRLTRGEDEFDDQIVESIEQFLPYRNEAIELFLTLAQYRDNQDTANQLHRFFEGLLPYLSPSLGSWEQEADNFRFIAQELFLYAIASLLKYQCFAVVAHLLRTSYYVRDNWETNAVSFISIRENMRSLNRRNQRLSLRRASLRADMLKQRAEAVTTGVTFDHLMQADFVLYLRSCFNVLRAEDSGRWWWPDTLLYKSRRDPFVFELFARAQSRRYFDSLKEIFDIDSKLDVDTLAQFYRANPQSLRLLWDWHSVEPLELMGYEQLATRP